MIKISELCCECNNCIDVCPVGAISINNDEIENKCRVIDQKKCINCHKCEIVCPMIEQVEQRVPIKTFAAVSKLEESRYSTSGGIFYSLACEIIRRNGIVFGAAYDEHLGVSQVAVETPDGLHRLQGSKYVKSNISDSIKKAKDALKSGRWVLYSGTPCQVAGLLKSIDKKVDKSKLILVDVICHGTPPQELFKMYLAYLEKKRKCPIVKFCFRDKAYGNKLIGCYIDAKNKKHIVTAGDSSYYCLFLNAKIYNQICYQCEYANRKRISDITIGDYWGVKENTHEFFSENNLDENSAVSAVIANTEKGLSFLESISNIIKYEVEYSKIAKDNPQLNSSSVCNPDERKTIFDMYRKGGYEDIEKYFKSNTTLFRYAMRIGIYTPNCVKKIIIKIINKLIK